jgi:DNA-binding MarR family transcriptional regulator
MTARREHRLVFLLNVAQRRLQRWIAAQNQQSGVTAVQSGLLFVLGLRDGVLMGEAGAALDLGPPGISGLVDRMTAANLIRRRADPDDGRAWRLWLTPAGRAALAQSKAGLTEINARLTEGFTDAEIDVVARWLASMQSKFPRGEDE